MARAEFESAAFAYKKDNFFVLRSPSLSDKSFPEGSSLKVHEPCQVLQNTL